MVTSELLITTSYEELFPSLHKYADLAAFLALMKLKTGTDTISDTQITNWENLVEILRLKTRKDYRKVNT